MQVYEEYVDKMAAVGATTASDLQELSTAMSKVASAASSMGVTFDDLNAQIATIVSVTRQAPESVGTALKTIYARLGDLKVDGVDEFGVKLGEVTTQLQTMGINILDQNGNMRQMSTVMTEVAEKWDTWTSAQRQAAAVAMAGKRQYNNLVALFDNWDMYGEALETSLNAAGTLEKQQETAMQSLANKMDVLKATAEDLYDSLFDTDTIGDFIDRGTDLLQLVSNFTDAVGGLNNIIPMLGSIGLRVFSEQIGRGLATIVNNARNAAQAAQLMKDNFEQVKLNFSDSSIFGTAGSEAEQIAMENAVGNIRTYYEKMYQYQSMMTKEQKEQYDLILNTKREAGELSVKVANQTNAWKDANEAFKLFNGNLINTDEGMAILRQEIDKVNRAASEIEQHFSEKNYYWKDVKEDINTIREDFKKFTSQLDLSDDQIAAINQKFKELKPTASTAKKDLEQLVKEIRELGQGAVYIDNDKAAIDRLTNSANTLDKSLTKVVDTQKRLTDITRTIGAVGQLASSIQTFSNIQNIIDDKDIDNEQKFLQIVTNLSFVLPMLITSLGKLNETFKITSSISEFVNSRLVAHRALVLADAAAEEMLVKAETAEVAISKVKGWAFQQEIANLAKKISAKQLDLVLTKESNAGLVASTLAGKRWAKMTLEQKEALKAKVIALAAEKKAQDSANASMEAGNAIMAASPIGIIVALAAAIAVVALAVKKYHEHLQKVAQTEIERLQKIQEEIDANRKLYESYQKALVAYEEGTGSKEDLITATESICDAYDIEIDKLAILNNNYKEITKSINEKRLAEIEESRANLKLLQEQQIIDLREEAKKGWGYEVGGNFTLDFNTENEWKKSVRSAVLPVPISNALNLYDLANSEKENLLRNIATENFSNKEGISSVVEGAYTVDINNMEAMKEFYASLIATRDAYREKTKEMYGDDAAQIMATDDDYQSLLDKIAQLEPKMQEIEDTEKKIKEQNILAELYSAEAVESLDEYYDLVRGIAEAYGYEVEEIEKIAKQFDYITNGYEKEAEILDAISKKVMRPVEELQNWWNNLPEEDKQLIIQGKVDFTHAFTEEAIEREIEFAKNSVQTYDVTKLTSISGTLASGNKLKKDDNEILKELSTTDAEAMAGFNDKSVLHQLDAIDELTQKRIASNQEYLDNTQEIVQKRIDILNEDHKQYDDLLTQKKELFDDYEDQLTEEEKEQWQNEIDIYTNELARLEDEIKEFEKIKEEGLSWEEIDTLGFNDLIAKIDMVTNKADSLKTAAELIGEGFTVAASDVDKFAATFPELLENMEVLSDGSLQLSKETVQENIAGVKAELEARTKAQLAEIDQQIELKKLDIEFTKKRLENIQEYLKGEQTAEELKTNLAQTTYDYKDELYSLTGEKIEELANFDIKSSVEEANSVTEAINAIGSAWAEVSRAHAAAIKGEEFKWDGVSFKGTASTVEEYASSVGASDIYAKYQEEYEAAFQAAEKLQSQYNTLNGELDELNAKRAIIESSSKAAINALDRVAAGKAGKEDKSSSSKDKKDKEKKELEDEFNKYFDIEKAIEAVDRQVSLLEEHQKNLHGKELIDSLKQENELIEKQTENYKKLYAAQQEEAKELGAILKGKGLEFTDDGAISNYAEATTAALAKYNAAVDAYNAGALDDAGFEIAEKSYERFKKQLERYEELYYKEMQDTFDKIDENNRKVLDNNLKAWETEIQVQLDLNEAEREWSKFFKEIGTDFKKVFKDLGAEMSAIAKEAGTYQSDIAVDIKAINDTMAEIDKLNADQATDHTQAISQAQEKLKELNDQLMDHANSLRDAYENAWDAYLEGIDQAAEKFDKLNDQFDRANNQLEFQGELIELMYGEKAYDLMDKLYEGQEHASRNQIQSVQQQLDFWKKLYNETSEGDKDHEKALEKMNELQDKLNDLTLDYIKTLKNEYGNAIDKILDDLNKKLTGGKGSDWLTEEWERVSNFSDIYFDGLEKAYHIQTLANKVEKDISKTYKENIKAQQKLAKYRDLEITKLKDIKNLRQEDLDIAEAKYDLILKEIALEESRNNKNAMKLVRNEQGNWSYQYVADEEEEDNRQQDKLDSNYNLYETANNAYNAVINEQLKAATDYTSQMKDLQMNEAIGEEEKNARMTALRDSFIEESEIRQEKANDYFNELKVAGTALGIELYEQDETAFAGMLDNELQYLNTFINTEKTDYLSLEEAFKTNCADMDMISRSLMENTRVDWSQSAEMLEALWNGDEDSVRVAVENAYSAMQDATQEYEDKITELEALVHMKFYGKEGEENIVNSIKMAEKETDVLKEKTKELVNESKSKLEELKGKLKETADSWYGVADSIQTAINKLATYLRMQGKEYTGGAASVNVPDAKTDRNEVTSSTEGNNGDNDGSGGGGGEEETGSKFSYKYFATEEDGTDTITGMTADLQTAKNIIETYRQEYGGDGYIRVYKNGKETQLRIPEYRTGGYTGEWNGDNGKLAVLHKKEMVLNADDTEKLLNTVSIIRNLQNKALDTAYQMAAIRTQMSASSYGSGVSPIQTDTGSTFYIDKLEFPNANSVDEIRMAIMSLPNVASQYVNRNVK